MCCGRLGRGRVPARQGWVGEKDAQVDDTQQRDRPCTQRKSQEAKARREDKYTSDRTCLI